MISSKHLQEWHNSAIDQGITELNVRSLSGDEPYQHLLGNFDTPRSHKDAQWRYIRKRYGQWESGGWWSNGLDPLNNWKPMDWGGYKPDKPRRANDGKLIKYEHPVQTKTRTFYPQVTRDIWRRVAKRSEIVLPDLKAIQNEEVSAAFWRWAVEKNVPIAITEGVKKAACLLSAGYVAIALPGINSGYRNPRDESGNAIGKPFLIPDLMCIATPGRSIYICFDQDTKQKTIRNVNRAIATFSKLLQQKSCEVRVVSWTQSYKGVDDLIANCGVDAYVEAHKAAIRLETWNAHQFTELTYPADITLNQRRIGELSIPDSAKLVAIKSAKGTGKTWTLEREVEKALEREQWVLVVGHRVQLVEALCKRFGINYVTEVRDSETGKLFGFGLCVDSLHPESQARFSAANWHDGIVILDEAEQIIWHSLNSTTCQSDRVPILRELKTLLTNVLQGDGRVYLADADLSDLSIDYVRSLTGINADPFVVFNEWKPSADECWDIYTYDQKNPSELVAALEQHIAEGGKPFVVCSAQKIKSKWSTQNLESYFSKKFPMLRILRIDRESVSDPSHPALGCIAHLTEVLRDYDMVLASSTMETGVSIDLEEHFSSVWGIFQGIQPINSACQFLSRMRESIPRHIWAAPYGIGKVGNGSTSVNSLLASEHKLVKANISLLKDADFDDIDIEFQPANLRTWARMAARVNLGMGNYRQSLIEALKAEGHRVNQAELIEDPSAISEDLEMIRDENHQAEAEAIAEAPDLTEKEYQELTDKRAKTKAERQCERKHELEHRYAVPCTADLVIKDDDHWYPKLMLHYYLTVGQNYLKARDTQKLKSQRQKGSGSIFIPDANKTQLSMAVRSLEKLGLFKLIKLLTEDGIEIKGSDEILQQMATIAKSNKWEIKAVLNISITDKDSPVAIAQKLLDKIGLQLEFLRKSGSRGNQQRIYGYLDPGDGRTEVFTAWLQRDREIAEKTQNVSSSDTVVTPNNKEVYSTELVTTNPDPQNGTVQAPPIVDADIQDAAELLMACSCWEMAQQMFSVMQAFTRDVKQRVWALLPEWKRSELNQWKEAIA